MLVPSFSTTTTVVLAFAGHVLAEPLRQPYKASNVARMSTRQIFGLSARDLDPNAGYNPKDETCGDGASCTEACGPTFQSCASNDGQTHCFDPAAKQTCCPNNSGDSCNAGFFCASDPKGATLCCPDGMSPEQCAKALGIPGGLTSAGTAPATQSPTSLPPAATPTNNAPVPAPTTAKPPANTAPPAAGNPAGPATSQGNVFVEPSASNDGAAGNPAASCTTLTSAVVHSSIIPDNSVGTQTLIIPAPTITPSVNSTRPVTVPTPTSSIIIAGANGQWAENYVAGYAVLAAIAAAVY